jgi:hypothetical protein
MRHVQPLDLLWTDEAVFRAKFDKEPFQLEHGLTGHPLFEIPRLLNLAQMLKRTGKNIAFDAGAIHVEDRWNRRPASTVSLEEAIEGIDRTGAWVILKHCELDAEYKALMERVMLDIERLSGTDLLKNTRLLEAQIMLTSPGRVTPYHIDNECNVLLQIRGEKDVSVFDQTDREVLTERELERFWVGEWNAADYKLRYQNRAKVFRLTPGGAVHIPVTAPHWVQNDNNVSVSLSINFEWKDELISNVYRANFILRSLGIRPRSPGVSHLVDSTKHLVMSIGFPPAQYTARRTIRLLSHLKRN